MGKELRNKSFKVYNLMTMKHYNVFAYNMLIAEEYK